ncbi:hypothetical protein L3Y34_011020 [Caenorhabditis briggsae]|uniref:Uncharacterized protein n=1 Tax=Caenorhabditis briggsae TaxID=6238 RepID=A0AAE8ZN00_CAEBR|nr:hypothetical protein L3Y34_011020 [Caenorhabditis briggsae]
MSDHCSCCKKCITSRTPKLSPVALHVLLAIGHLVYILFGSTQCKYHLYLNLRHVIQHQLFIFFKSCTIITSFYHIQTSCLSQSTGRLRQF